ncbi:bifunctional metallophosphatase/5'-nucleotidase [Curtobacterium sp. RRHDQ10]|uniref:bifunctional metallophosphatase/5'-nucleotidase n=1 Tax=Curtobacterium phyllosphaerae TaxID=3413379 RepID=UPI003BF05F07
MPARRHPARSSTTTPGRTRFRRAALATVALGTIGLVTVLGTPASAVEDAGATPVRAAPTAAPAAAADLATIDLLDINDFHGRIEPVPSSPSPKQGDPAGAAGLAVSAIGNHELDRGQADLRDRIIGADGSRNADFDYVSANLVVSATGEPAFDAYSVKEVGGVRVGFIGATTELIPELVSPAGIEGLEMTDVVDSVNAVATDLTDGVDTNGEADVLVLLLHEGAATPAITSATDGSDFADIARGVTSKVSAILSGHTHQLYDHEIIPTDGTVARPVIQTGSYGGYLGHLRLQVDTADMSVASVTAENVPLARNGFTADPAVTPIVDAAKAVAAVKGKVKVGEITDDLRRATQTNGDENRGGESTLGNFVAEVQRTATERNGAQIAFMNPGGLRADMLAASTGADDPTGNVTYQEAAAVQPFANTLVVLDLTGAQIKAALEQQWQPAGAGRPFLKLGVSDGFSSTYDPDAAAGSRITGMTLDDTAIDAGTTYKVTVNSFLASGGDNFTAFDGAAAKADSGQVDLQAQVDYFASNPVVSPALTQRAVGVSTTPAPAEGFAVGDSVTIDLSSLTFSTAGEQGGTVSVGFDGQELASAEIDPRIVDTTDEQGRASLTFTVPEAAAAAARTGGTVPVTDTTRAADVVAAVAAPRTFVVTIASTGQQIALPLVVAVPAVDPTDPGDDVPGAGDPGAGGSGVVGSGADGSVTGVRSTAGRTGTDALAFTGGSVLAPAVAAGVLLTAGILLQLRRRRALLGD